MTDWRQPILPAAASERAFGVEMRHLAALEAIAREGSFRGAAESLGYVQSAISHQLAALERMVGTRLVERVRGNSPVSLTDAGTLLLDHAAGILAHFRAAQEQLEALAEGRAGTLRVGAFQSVASNILPRVIAAYTRSSPGFRVEPTEAPTDTPLLAALLIGELELTFTDVPPRDPAVDSIALMQEPFVLLVSAESEFARRDEPPALAELDGVPLIGFRAVSRAHDLMLAALEEHGVTPRFEYSVDLNRTLQALVATDIGIALVPYLTIDPIYGGTVVLELPELPERTISLAWRAGEEQSLAAQQFIAAAQATVPKFRRR